MPFRTFVLHPYDEAEYDLNGNAGTDALTFSTITAEDQSLVILNVCAFDEDNNITAITLRKMTRCGGGDIEIAIHMPAAAGDALNWNGELILTAGDTLRVIFDGVVAGDNIRAFATGHWMRKVHPRCL